MLARALALAGPIFYPPVGVIDHGYPEDGKTIFQDIGASKAPQSDCPAAPAGSPSDCSAPPAADCANQPAADYTN